MQYKESILKRVNGDIEVVKAPPLLERGELADVVAIRGDVDNTKCTNIQWVLGHWHDCAGFEWGYAGQGPTDFARNILMHFTEDREFSKKHQEEFCVEFIADMPRDQGYIKKEDILAFITLKRE